MALSWNEIKSRALAFSNEWAGTSSEEADAKPFLDAFFEVFGVPRRKIGTFEHKVKKLSNSDGYIDLLWKGVILVEMKSLGKDLAKAHQQAIDYTHGLQQHDLPKYILVCDFNEFRLFDTEEQTTQVFTLDDLVNHVQHFGFIAGYQKKTYSEQDPVNIKAAELMGKLHDQLKAIGYQGHPLEVYLVRLLFCLFAEDTTIFEKQQFQDYIEQRTNADGSDLAARLAELFQTLNTHENERFKNLDEQLNAFNYVNGKLFAEVLPTASFDSAMRQALLECCYIDWSQISPAIFGSMFQSVMNPTERRNLGAHYTSEKNILKLIKPLFMDELWAEFNSIASSKNQAAKTANLDKFHTKLASLTFMDPACGCGNFLIITYRELRLLELAVIKQLYKTDQLLQIDTMLKLSVDQMVGIEYEEFPARIAEVAMWLIDHQMNRQVSAEYGQYYARLPLRRAAQLHHGDALTTDWQALIPNTQLSYILGNPPFIGSNNMKQNQRDQIVKLLDNAAGGGTLDYVSGWYIKAAAYIQGTAIKVAFVSTNSIVQGEQTSLLWGAMLGQYNITIHFAHRTFKWSNEARGNAAVYCVIIGFANYDTPNKRIYEYDDAKGEPHEIKAKNINAYLIDSKNILVEKNKKPICMVPEIIKGNYYAKSEGLIVEESDLDYLVSNEPNSKNWIKLLIGADEFINNRKRYCLWLVDCPPDELRKMPLVMDRVNRVREDRLKSKDKGMQNLVSTQFRETNNPESCLVIPVVSSERRKYIPIGFIDKNTISTNGNLIMPNGNVFHFGILLSVMHNVWTKKIGGYLGTSIRYSKDIVYNNYPWPANASANQVKAIEAAAQAVLDARLQFPSSSLADLYDPLTMPPALVKAHNALDKAVDLAYRPQPFTSDAGRMEYLFDLYGQYTADLLTKPKAGKVKAKAPVKSANL